MRQAIIAFVFLALACAALYALSRIGPLGGDAEATTERPTSSFEPQLAKARASAEDLRGFVDEALEETRVARRAHSDARLAASRAKEEEEELFARIVRYEKRLEAEPDAASEDARKIEASRDEVRARLREVQVRRGESERNAEELGRDLERRRTRVFALEEGLSHVEGLIAGMASMRETAEENGELTRLEAALHEINSRLRDLEVHREALRFRVEGGSLALPPGRDAPAEPAADQASDPPSP